jgi:hypothetical protein
MVPWADDGGGETTEEHYAPYVESFQRVLDAATSKLDFGTWTWYTKKNTR